MIDLEKLKAFLINANNPHALGTADTVLEADGSRTITYAEGNLRMHDNFFGGEPYGGRLVIFRNDKPLFMEVYYGRSYNTALPIGDFYGFLREALQHPGDTNPFRGPTEYHKGSLTYRSTTEGDITNHVVKEYIYDGGTEIYSAIIIRVLVDQNAQGAM